MQQCDTCGERSLNIDNHPYPAGSIRLRGSVLRGGLYPIPAQKTLICGRCVLNKSFCLIGDSCNHEVRPRLNCPGCDTPVFCDGCAVYFLQAMMGNCPICYHRGHPENAPEWMRDRLYEINDKKEASYHSTQ